MSTTSAATPASSPAPVSAPATPVASTPEVAQGGQQASPEPQAKDPFENLTDEQYDQLLRKRKHKVKVNKEEQELDYDELKAGYQLKKHSHQQLQSAAELKKSLEGYLAEFKGNPVEALRKLAAHPALGLDARKIATDLLAEELEAEQLSPEAREAKELKKRIAEYEAKEAKAAKDREDRETAEYRKRMSNQIENEIVAAMEPSGLPPTEHTLRRVAYYMKEGLKRDINITAEAAVKLVREDYDKEHRDLIGRLPPEKLAEYLGEDVLGKVQGHLVSKFKAEPPAPAVREPREKKPAEDKPKRSLQQVLEEFRQSKKREG